MTTMTETSSSLRFEKHAFFEQSFCCGSAILTRERFLIQLALLRICTYAYFTVTAEDFVSRPSITCEFLGILSTEAVAEKTSGPTSTQRLLARLIA